MSATVQEPIHISGDMVIIPKKQYDDMQRELNNAVYLNKLHQSIEQSKRGQVVIKTMEELEAIANG